MIFSHFKKKKAINSNIHQIISWGIRASIAVITSWALVNGDWETFSISILALVLTFVPVMISHKLKIELPVEFNLIMVLFIYLSVVLGSALGAYYSYPWWDSMLHTASGVVLSYAGFLILYILHQQKKLQAAPSLIAMFTFTFGIALSAIWEIYEFTIDSIFGLDMQRNLTGNGLTDTMWDIIIASIGSAVITLMAYLYLKSNKGGFIVAKITDKFLKLNPKLKKKWWQI